ncbi:MAG: hypothetical protein HND51_12595, partial [Chloroflexi bacterium]|nr:hypothetical protein [Chloroflexota bacterium]NOH12478.1 hypothetical protein [Chloroflexota bacterium]
MKHKGLVLSLLIMMVVAACSGAVSNAPEQPEVVLETQTTEVVVEAVPSSTPLPPTATATLGIQHSSYPGEPKYRSGQWIPECKTGYRVDVGQQIEVGLGCDRWEDNYLERPHDVRAQDYYPGLDITAGQFGSEGQWLYAMIETFSADEVAASPNNVQARPINTNAVAETLTGSYAIEIDLDFDMRGDVLIVVTNPAGNLGTEWGVTGVQVWVDQNSDIGSETAFFADGQSNGDGYESLIFDGGRGTDADLAWARISPDDASVVEFAFKPTAVGGATIFHWMMWASAGALDPAMFDYVDAFDGDVVWMVDNTCAWTFGGQPRELENTCPVYVPPTLTPEPTKE